MSNYEDKLKEALPYLKLFREVHDIGREADAEIKKLDDDYCLELADVYDDHTETMKKHTALKKQNVEMRQAMHVFCDQVNTGEVENQYMYDKFKEILERN